jgi:acetyl-CoA carboxylase biotin carboxyl carrier protein
MGLVNRFSLFRESAKVVLMNDDRYLTDILPRLLRILQNSDVRELEVQEGDVRVRLHRSGADLSHVPREVGVPAETPAPAEPETAVVRASIVGTFYRAGKPGMAPLVSEGSRVEESTVIGIIEALQVLTDVEAECAGIVTAVLATDGQPVEYNQPLLEILPNG